MSPLSAKLSHRLRLAGTRRVPGRMHRHGRPVPQVNKIPPLLSTSACYPRHIRGKSQIRKEEEKKGERGEEEKGEQRGEEESGDARR